MSTQQRPFPGEMKTQFVARLRDLASRLDSAWGGEDEVASLRARADRIELGTEPMPASDTPT